MFKVPSIWIFPLNFSVNNHFHIDKYCGRVLIFFTDTDEISVCHSLQSNNQGTMAFSLHTEFDFKNFHSSLCFKIKYFARRRCSSSSFQWDIEHQIYWQITWDKTYRIQIPCKCFINVRVEYEKKTYIILILLSSKSYENFICDSMFYHYCSS